MPGRVDYAAPNCSATRTMPVDRRRLTGAPHTFLCRPRDVKSAGAIEARGPRRDFLRSIRVERAVRFFLRIDERTGARRALKPSRLHTGVVVAGGGLGCARQNRITIECKEA